MKKHSLSLFPRRGRLADEVRRVGGRVLPRAPFAPLLCAAVLLLPAAPAAAHPHVWVDVQTTLVVDEQGRLAAIEEHWTFDEFYTVFATEDFDTNGDGTFGEPELKALTEVNLDSLAEWDFFSEAATAAGPVPLGAPINARSTYEDGRLALHFTLPVADPVATPVTVKIYDPTYYVSFDFLEKNHAKMAGAGAERCDIEIAKPDAEEVYLTLPESFFNDPDQARIGERFASQVRLVCETTTGALR